MYTKCPYCNERLRIEMTAQFVERVDPDIVKIYSDELERTQKRADAQGGMFGGMMRMAAGMAKSMHGMMLRTMQALIELPPMVMVLRCMECGAALSVEIQSANSSD